MEKIQEENGDKKESGTSGEGAASQPSPIPVGGKVRDIHKMVSGKMISGIVFLDRTYNLKY